MFALVDLEVLDQLELSGLEWTVLHRIMRAVNPETNWANVQAVEIAAELHCTPPNVQRVMKDLRRRRIIETLKRGMHRVNPHIMFRGSNQDWDTATDRAPEPIWERESRAS